MSNESTWYTADDVPQSQVIVRFDTRRWWISVFFGNRKAKRIVNKYNRKNPNHLAEYKTRRADDYRKMTFKVFYNIKKREKNSKFTIKQNPQKTTIMKKTIVLFLGMSLHGNPDTLGQKDITDKGGFSKQLSYAQQQAPKGAMAIQICVIDETGNQTGGFVLPLQGFGVMTLNTLIEGGYSEEVIDNMQERGLTKAIYNANNTSQCIYV